MELAVALLVSIVDRAVESGALAKEERGTAMDAILFEVKESGDVDAALKLIKLYDERGLQPKVSRHNRYIRDVAPTHGRAHSLSG